MFTLLKKYLRRTYLHYCELGCVRVQFAVLPTILKCAGKVLYLGMSFKKLILLLCSDFYEVCVSLDELLYLKYSLD